MKRVALASLAFLAAGTSPAQVRETHYAPAVDHHQHLLSPSSAALVNRFDGPSTAKVRLNPQIAALLDQRAAKWNDQAALGQLHTADTILLQNGVVQGRSAVAAALAKGFRSGYRLLPTKAAVGSSAAQVTAYLVRSEGAASDYFGSAYFSLVKEADGQWRIAGESLQFPGPRSYKPMSGSDLIKLMDDADIARAVVLSVAYFFGTPFAPAEPRELARVRAENDWTAAEVARFPNRLIAFCSVNPLKDYAVAEVERCTRQLGMRGLKLHFGNSDVDLSKPDHVTRVRAVFAASNRLRIPIVAHLWTIGRQYGAKDSRLFIDRILPAAPDIVVQVAHMAGAGPGWTDDALGVLAEAVAARDPRTRNLYFDVATVADEQPPERLKQLAARIRQIGVHRILYGSDAAFGGRKTANEEWGTFRGMVPLDDQEFAAIRENVAPYLR
jgi:predicted TIM-barrel fold metal-dependent hydrolase